MKTISKSEVNEVVDITTLRKDKKLKALVRKELKKMGLVDTLDQNKLEEAPMETSITNYKIRINYVYLTACCSA